MLVKAKKDIFLDGSLRVEGEEFDYTGPKNTNVAPVVRSKDAPVEETDEQGEKEKEQRRR